MKIKTIIEEFRGKTFSSSAASEAWLSGRMEELLNSAPLAYLQSGEYSAFDKGYNAAVDNFKRWIREVGE